MILLLLILTMIIDIIILYKIHIILHSNTFVISIIKTIGDSVIYSVSVWIKNTQSKNNPIFEEEIFTFVNEVMALYQKDLLPNITKDELEILKAYTDYKIRTEILPKINTKVRL
jgi:hypothetical protein